MYEILKGIKVVEVAQWVLVPTAGAILADWGADVIKIEHPERGDALRGLASRAGGGTTSNDRPWMEFSNRGKRSVGIDLSSPDGREILYRLVDEADVFLTNALASSQQHLGIDAESIRRRNPSIIYAVGTAWGSRGSKAGQPGYDMAQAWSAGGISYQMTAPDDAEPPLMPSSVGDVTGALAIALGIVGGLFRRERTSEGATVEVSLYAAGLWMMGQYLSGAANGPAGAPGRKRHDVSNPLICPYRTQDGRWLQLVFTQPDRWWPDLCKHLDRPDLIDDPRFVDIRAREENKDACLAELDAIFATKSFAEWVEIFATLEGAWAPIASPEEIVADPQALVNGYFPVAHGENGDVTVVSSPVTLDGQPLGDLRTLSDFGADTDQVLLDLGYTWDEIIELKTGNITI